MISSDCRFLHEQRLAQRCGVCWAEWLAYLVMLFRVTVANCIAPAEYWIFVILPALRLYAGFVIQSLQIIVT